MKGVYDKLISSHGIIISISEPKIKKLGDKFVLSARIVSKFSVYRAIISISDNDISLIERFEYFKKIMECINENGN